MALVYKSKQLVDCLYHFSSYLQGLSSCAIDDIMDTLRLKSNARKSTHSGKPSTANQEQLRLREALRWRLGQKAESSNSPSKQAPLTTAAKRSGWSLSARARHDDKKEEDLLTPIIVSNGNETSQNGDVNGEKKSPDQRSLWSVFSTPKALAKTETQSLNAGDIQEKLPSEPRVPSLGCPGTSGEDRNATRKETSPANIVEAETPPSNNIFEKIKPLRTASRNFFANFNKKLKESERLEKETVKLKEAVDDDLSHKSRQEYRTSVKQIKLTFKLPAESAKNKPRETCSDNKTAPVYSKQPSNVNEHDRDQVLNDQTKPSDKCSGQRIADCEKDASESSYSDSEREVLSKNTRHAKTSDKDKDLCDSQVLVPSAKEDSEQVSAELSSDPDESECLVIDEQAHEPSPTDQDQLTNDKHEETENAGHVLRVWSLRSQDDGEATSNDTDKLDSLENPEEDPVNNAGFLTVKNNTACIQSETSSVTNEVPKETNSEISNNRVEDTCSEQTTLEENKDCHISMIDQELEVAGENLSVSINSDDSFTCSVRSESRPNTHHLLQELDSLLDSKINSIHSNEDHSIQHLSSDDDSGRNDVEDVTDLTDHTDVETDSSYPSIRNIFSLFKSQKESLPVEHSVSENVMPDGDEDQNLSKPGTIADESMPLENETDNQNEGPPVVHESSSKDITLNDQSDKVNDASHTGDVEQVVPPAEHAEREFNVTVNSSDSDNQPIPILSPATCRSDQSTPGKGEIFKSPPPPDLTPETTSTQLVLGGESLNSFGVGREPEEDYIDDINILSFESKELLVSYSKRSRVKMQKKTPVPVMKVPVKKCPPFKPAMKWKDTLEDRIRLLEGEFLSTMAFKGVSQVVHPALCMRGINLEKIRENDLVVFVSSEDLKRSLQRDSQHAPMHRTSRLVIVSKSPRH